MKDVKASCKHILVILIFQYVKSTLKYGRKLRFFFCPFLLSHPFPSHLLYIKNMAGKMSKRIKQQRRQKQRI